MANKACFSVKKWSNIRIVRDLLWAVPDLAIAQITSKLEIVAGQTLDFRYSYDPAGRLTDVTVNGDEQSHYEYDGNGNRLLGVVGGVSRIGVYDVQDKLLSYGGNSYQYSASGSLTNKSTGGQNTQYRYDAVGNLLSVKTDSGAQIEYVTDGARRIAKIVDGLTVRKWIYKDFLEPVAECDGSGNLLTVFVYGARKHVPDYMIKTGGVYRLISDHLGSVRLVVNSVDGSVAQRLDYDEWGLVLVDTNPGFQPFGFCGGLYDSGTGLVRFGHRDYQAETGRWTAKDPILFGGGQVNLYLYCHGDPIRLMDLFGLGEPTNPLHNFCYGDGPVTTADLFCGTGCPAYTPEEQAFIVVICSVGIGLGTLVDEGLYAAASEFSLGELYGYAVEEIIEFFQSLFSEPDGD